MADGKSSIWFDVFVKEGLKKAVWSFLTILFILSFVIVDYFYDIAVPDLVEKSSFYPNISRFFDGYLFPTAGFIKTHPYSSFFMGLFSATIVGLISFIVHLNRKIRQLPINSHANAARVQVSECIGVIQRWPNTLKPVGDENSPWKQLVSEISNPKNNSIRIIGANGERTFADASSPLYEPFMNFRGEIRVILLDPNCGETAKRAAGVKTALKDYQKSINKSVAYLKKLHLQGRTIRGKFYTGKPNWKLIITNSSAWVQYYTPGGPDIENTPMYVFENIESNESFYNIFSKEFDRIWERCGDNYFAGR